MKEFIEFIVLFFDVIYGVIDFLMPLFVVDIMNDIREIKEKIKKR